MLGQGGFPSIRVRNNGEGAPTAGLGQGFNSHAAPLACHLAFGYKDLTRHKDNTDQNSGIM